ncbi:MAG: Mur ligase domain-containing protein [Kiritimatiellae bacterium]|nr:Mur ligase domain-containing protein [Kiritimatiellia bacterium]MDD5521215.1 Mur ligase domain-containing protein [Kiritimatiellia bacterium]
MNRGDKRHYHFVGVAGVGMSAIAQVALEQGNTVTGSDRDNDAGEALDVIRKLRIAGVKFVPQDGTGVNKKTAGVVVSTAIEKDNPDVLAAERLGIPLIHRSGMLAKFLDGTSCIAITGTSGKSTVTGMIGWILDQLGADPVVVNGAPILNWVDEKTVGNVRYGSSNLWVVEADESDKSLLKYHPDWAVITNVSKDHFALDETLELFKTFSRQVKKGRVSIIDQPDLLRSFNPQIAVGHSNFVYKDIEFVVPVAGKHNAENAFFAVMLCERLGFPLDQIRKALISFKGIQRRLEMIGEARGITVIDDYGHNPVKIKAAWLAVEQARKKVIGVWRPHGYRPLVTMMDELVSVFTEICRPSDCLFIMPVYDAGGTADRSIKSEKLVELLRNKNIPASYSPDVDGLIAKISDVAVEGDVVIVMGARDPYLPQMARRILKSIRTRE